MKIYSTCDSGLCSNVFLLFMYTSLGLRSEAADASTTTTTNQRPRPQGTAKQFVDCGQKWTCDGYDYSRLTASKRGHYTDKNCACDDLCVLLQDCCPDVRLTQSQTSSSDAAQGGVSNGSAASTAFRQLSAEDLAREGKNVNKLTMPGSGTAQRISSQDAGDKKSFSKNGVSLMTNNEELASRLSREETSVPPFGRDVLGSNPRFSSNSADPSSQGQNIYADYNLTIDMFSCIKDAGINAVNYVSVVSRCPEHFEDMVVMELCHNVTEDDMMTRLPVSGTTTRVLYRNMFCAICHKEPFVYWTAGVNCSSSTQLPYNGNSTLAEVSLNSTECAISFQPPSDLYQWRPCRANVTRKCSESFALDTPRSRQIATKCEEGEQGIQRLVFSSTAAAYRNEYCALCNNVHNTLHCGFPLTAPSIKERPTHPYSFSILLDINTNSGSTTVGRRSQSETVERQEAASCDVGQVFDPFRVTCRPVDCGPGRHFIGNQCVEKPTTTPESLMSADFTVSDMVLDYRDVNVVSDRDPDCISIRLNDTEYRLSNDGILELLGTGTFYNTSQYVVIDKDVFLCVNYSQNYTRTVTEKSQMTEFTFSLAEAVISTCGICISLIALVVTIVVYASLRTLRNIPGRNLLSLVLSLFLADSLLLAAPFAGEVFLACAVIAGVMHYFFLASFVWMNVMAVDVWLTFSKAFVGTSDRQKSSKRFLMYSCYAWLTPVAFVLPAVLLQLFSPGSSVSPDYGVGICWLSNKYALLLFFASPLFLLLVLNIVFFLISARNISRAKRTSARMLGKEEEGKMAIYVKLTVVLGITWVLGFLAALIPGNLILTYSFVVMNTLQGLFICLSFVFTKKVLRLLRSKFCGRKRKFRSTKSGSTDTTNVACSRKMSSISGSAKLSNVAVV